MNMMVLHLNPWIWIVFLVGIIVQAVALWRAGRNNQSYWFIAIVIFNSSIIIPLIYLIFAQRNKNPKK